MSGPENKQLEVLMNEFKRKLRLSDGEMVEIKAAADGAARWISVRKGKNSKTNQEVILADVFQKEQPIGHYDWVIATDATPLPPYANGNRSQRSFFEGPQNEPQALATDWWNGDGVEITTVHQGQKLGSLLVVSSVLAIDAHQVPHLTIGLISEAGRGLWRSFESQRCPVDNPFPGSLNPYEPAKDWIDVRKFLTLNSIKVNEVLAHFLKP
ncbi:MAG TPA: hypothetical protein VD999_06130 [Vitreimonas sp.]|nr:hypothetical protein [Vitreimonas sp.]